VPGGMKLADFEALTNFGIEDDRMTTIGGVVLRHMGQLPEARDVIKLENIRITVLEMDGNRIARLRTEKLGDVVERESPETVPEPPADAGDQAEENPS